MTWMNLVVMASENGATHILWSLVGLTGVVNAMRRHTTIELALRKGQKIKGRVILVRAKPEVVVVVVIEAVGVVVVVEAVRVVVVEGKKWSR